MKIPVSWLADFMDINNTVSEYVDMLNQLGFEVEGVSSPGDEIAGVIIVKVLGTEPHPNADRLKLVDIDTGSEQKKIVCGADNVRAGITVAYAPSGATLPGGFKLDARKIRGIVSDGMLCSARELGLGEDHEGLLELSDNLQAGIDAVKALELDDSIIDISITPNRPDAMSIVGIARELCAGFNQELKLPNFDSFLDGIEIDDTLPVAVVRIEDYERCPRFVGRTLRVNVKESPDWMRSRLQKVDQNSINSVVDVTNYVLMEWGRPLHVFDVDVLGTTDIVVRRAKENEKLVLLDESEIELDPEDLVIATADGKAQSLAGIKGGKDSGTYDTTTTVYLESAYFTPEAISKSSKRLGIRSESSARFERGADPSFASYGANRACQLFAEVADAKISPIVVDDYPTPIEPKTIALRPSRISRILGDEISLEDTIEFLKPLVLSIEKQDSGLNVTVPTFRPDLTREIDLIEEVARRRGLNTFAPTLPNSLVEIGGLTRNQKRRRSIENALVGAGLMEAYTLPLESDDIYYPFGFSDDDIVRAKNPLKSDASVLRPMIVPGLLRSASRNIARGISDMSFFEMGKIFLKPFDDNLQPDEQLHLAVLLCGNIDSRPYGANRKVDVFDIVDLLHIITDTLNLSRPEIEVKELSEAFHPTRSGEIVINGEKCGVIGEIVGEISAVAFEIDLDKVLSIKVDNKEYKKLSVQPHVSFDLALIVDKSITSYEIESSIKYHGGDELERVTLFDMYEGDKIGVDSKSLAYALRVRPKEGTFDDKQLAKYRQKLLDGLKQDCKAVLRNV